MKSSKIFNLTCASALILGLALLTVPSQARLPTPVPDGGWEGNCPDLHLSYAPGTTYVGTCQETNPWTEITRQCTVVLYNGTTEVKTNCFEIDWLPF